MSEAVGESSVKQRKDESGIGDAFLRCRHRLFVRKERKGSRSGGDGDVIIIMAPSPTKSDSRRLCCSPDPVHTTQTEGPLAVAKQWPHWALSTTLPDCPRD